MASTIDLEIKKEYTPLVAELTSLGEWVKALEDSCPKILDPSKWTLMRVDGHKFSTYTARFKNKRDQGLIDAMVHAATDWLLEMQGATVYVQSDEATLVLPPIKPDVIGMTLPFNGRVGKLTTLSAGLFSTRFNKYIPEEHRGVAYFDCRAFQVDTVEQVRDVFRWRQLDAFRNGVSTIARTCKSATMSKKAIEMFNTKEKLDMIRKQVGDLYAADHIVHGTFVKKELIDYGMYKRTGTRKLVLGNDYIIHTPTANWLTSKYMPEEVLNVELIKKLTGTETYVARNAVTRDSSHLELNTVPDALESRKSTSALHAYVPSEASEEAACQDSGKSHETASQ